MLYSMAQQAMFFVSQQGLAASPVRQPSNSASLSLLAEHLLDEGLTDIKLFGDLSDGAFAFFIGGNDSLSQIKGISFHTVELTPIVSRIQSKTVIKATLLIRTQYPNGVESIDKRKESWFSNCCCVSSHRAANRRCYVMAMLKN